MSNRMAARSIGRKSTAGTRNVASESTRRKLLGACATVVGISAAALPRVAHADGANVQHIWNPSTTGNWSAAGSWNLGGVANAAGDYAQNTIGSGNATLDINATVGSLQSRATSNGAWTINALGSNTFTLDGTGISSTNNGFGDAGVASIFESASGLFTVSPNITMATSLDVGVAASGGLTIGGNIAASTTATLKINNSYTGSSPYPTLALNGTIGATGSEIDIVNASTGTKGTISLSNAIGGAAGTGATITITNGASTGTQNFGISGNLGASVTTVTQNSSTSTMVLSGNNTNFVGAVNVSAGTLSVGADNNLGGSAATVLLNGGTLSTSANIVNSHTFTIGANGGTINVPTTGQYYFDTTNALTGSGNLTVTGTGTLVANTGNLRVDHTNTYSGNLIAQNGGTFEYGTQGAVASAATFTIGNQGELAVQGNPATYLSNAITVSGGTNSVLSFENGNLGVFSGPITLNANALIGLRDWYAYATSISGTISGVISGNGFGITTTPGSSTGGVLTLTNANMYTGATTIAANTSIQLGSGSGIGSLSANSAITDNGTLILNRSNAATQGTDFSGATISGTGGFTQAGPGTTTLNVSNSYSGVTTVNAGTLKLDFTASSPTSIINNTTLALGGGTLQVVGSSAGASQSFASTTLNVGASTISVASGAAAQNVSLGAITRNAGSIVTFITPALGNITTTTGTASSIIVGGTGSVPYAVVADSGGNMTDFAAKDSGNLSVGAGSTLAAAAYSSPTSSGNQLVSGGNWPTTIMDFVNNGSNTGIRLNSTAEVVSGLRVNSNRSGNWTIDTSSSGRLLSVGSILTTVNMGAYDLNISGPGGIRQPTSGGDLNLIADDTLGELNISALVQTGSGTSVTNLVKAGRGTLTLTAVNNYSGQTDLEGGATVINAYSGLGGGATPTSLATVNFYGGTLLGNGTTVSTDYSSSVTRAVFIGATGAGVAATSGSTFSIGGVISGTGPLAIGTGTLAGTGGSSPNPAVVGNGTVVFTGTNNTYTGVTTLAGDGTLALSAASSTNNISTSTAISVGTGSTLNVTALSGGGITLAGGQALGGTGAVTGNVTVAAGSTISAGTSMALSTGPTNTTGTLTTGNQTWSVGGKFPVKINETNGAGTGVSGSGTAGGTTGWDTLTMSSLNIASLGSGGNTFAITLSSPGGAISDFSNTSNYVWTIASISTGGPFTPGAILATTNNAGQSVSSSQFTLDTTGFVSSNPVLSSSSFYLEAIGSSGGSETLEIGYNAAPEPGTAMLVLGGAMPMLLSRRRRRVASSLN